MAVRRLRESLGIEDISIHDMRRAVSSFLKRSGFSRDVRDLVLNHKDPSVTGEHYEGEERMEKQVRLALSAWSDHVATITGQTSSSRNVIPIRSAPEAAIRRWRLSAAANEP